MSIPDGQLPAFDDDFVKGLFRSQLGSTSAGELDKCTRLLWGHGDLTDLTELIKMDTQFLLRHGSYN